MDCIEKRNIEYKDDIEQLEEEVSSILDSLKNIRQFGDFYENVKDTHDMSGEDIIEMYMHNFQTYLDRKQMLEEYRNDYEEFKKFKDDPLFQKEYEQLEKINRRLLKKINEIYKSTMQSNYIIVIPRNHEGWFTHDYIKEQWNEIVNIRDTVISTTMIFPIIEIISLGSNFQFDPVGTDAVGMSTLNVNVTDEYNASVVHKVDLTDIIQMKNSI